MSDVYVQYKNNGSTTESIVESQIVSFFFFGPESTTFYLIKHS